MPLEGLTAYPFDRQRPVERLNNRTDSQVFNRHRFDNATRIGRLTAPLAATLPARRAEFSRKRRRDASGTTHLHTLKADKKKLNLKYTTVGFAASVKMSHDDQSRLHLAPEPTLIDGAFLLRTSKSSSNLRL